MSTVYNASIPTKTYIEKSICNNTYTSRNYRLACIDKVYKREPGLRKILDKAPLWNHHTKVLVDIKKQQLTEGQYTCANKGWHLDGKGIISRRTAHDSLFHIIQWGGAPTLFIKHPFNTDVLGLHHMNVHQKTVAHHLHLDGHPRYELEPYIYHSYGEFHWHRCGQATEDCTRFFIRIIETDYIKEQKIKPLDYGFNN